MRTRSPYPSLPVLLFGAGITALGVLRALSVRGITCYAAEATDCPILTRSRWYRPTEPQLALTMDSDELATFLAGLELPGAVLIACTDEWAVTIAGLSGANRERFPSCSPARAVVEALNDKDLFGALVRRLAIPHPATVPIAQVSDLEQLTDRQLASGFLKPTSSLEHRRRFGTKGAFVSSRAGAAAHVREAAACGIDFVFQEWIPGPHSASILLDGLVDGNGTIHGLTSRRRVRQYPPRLGTTASSVGIPLAQVGEAVDSTRRLLAGIAYRGFFNIEYKYDERDGHYKIIEVNPRPCYYTGTLAAAGVDLPWMAYHDARGLPVPAVRSYPTGRHALHETGDGLAILAALASRHRPEGAVLRMWLTGDRALFWWSDPMPAIGSTWHDLRRLATRSRRASARRTSTGSGQPAMQESMR